ncbi:MAG: carboxypeptidase-like regulatory domain-containing protein [Bacteroidota bacterium]|nr:carboxypeptidase-like regulatory domain-containing protein [Bacteroidota bacterium]
MNKILSTIILLTFVNTGFSQSRYVISGKVTEGVTGMPLQNATIHLIGSNYYFITKTNGSFNFTTAFWHDSLEISTIGFSTFFLQLQHGQTENIKVVMKSKVDVLQEVVVGISKKPGKSFMEKVIEHKENNNPSRFRSYSYQRYTRNELDIDNIDFQKSKRNGLKSMMLKTYAGIDSSAKNDKELPIYFTERLANNYHSVSPDIDRENIIAKKNLGLKTDEILSKLDRFYFNLNIYDQWIPVFDQTYVSPLNDKAFNYYNYFQGDTLIENGDTIQQIRFTPIRSYDRAFNGYMWINTKTFALETVNMHLSKNANRNFVSDIRYIEDYKQIYDSSTDKWVYMPFKFSSEVKFESGLELLGLPVPESKSSVKFFIKNTTVTDKIKLNISDPTAVIGSQINKEQTTDWDKPESFWSQNRSDSLTIHEKNIYRMIDTLKQNKLFQRDVQLVAFAGSGYLDAGNRLRFGPYTSFISRNPIEGWRFRIGFWTMPGISKKMNLFGYGAYGTKDQQLKGMLGIKYVWNNVHFTKTTISYASDYDFIIDQKGELDKDNIINTSLRKNIPYTRMYIDQAILKHEQYLTQNFSAIGSLSYKVLNPIFDFKYRPINSEIDNIFDTVFQKKLPVTEASVGIRYAHNERTTILNYDNIKLGTFSPILTANFSYGIEQGKSQFEFQKIDIGIEQRLRLPPKSILYYKIEAGKIFGTLPYLLLNIPAGNEYYVSSKYQFNAMSPYEFASDRYISLHTRLNLGGTIFDKIPFLQKLGWRERLSFNAYWGDMTNLNIEYNKGSNFNLIGKSPYMESGIGIENIFHIMSIEYYRRLNYLNNPYARKDGVYLGLTLTF